jgi:hypothetical protein
MTFEGGLASDLVTASVLGPAPVGQPASQGGPQAEFHIRDRMSLLKIMKSALIADIPPTVWACLWLSDVDKLRVLVNMAIQQPLVCHVLFQWIESEAKIVQKCEDYRLPYVLVNVDLLILSREPKRAQAFCLLKSSATIYSTYATFPGSTIPTSTTFPNSTTFLIVTTISSTAILYVTD